ncbi:angiogenin isoform X1 [Etheostoma spectabile]|uniref:angiogenin isoform X1 n=1 Tax=Etheostoma spectabile TaxID=54343 RepID=UPI0013AEB4A1|nr:angiogenin isoform X1 [Etheostoma spectabile]
MKHLIVKIQLHYFLSALSRCIAIHTRKPGVSLQASSQHFGSLKKLCVCRSYQEIRSLSLQASSRHFGRSEETINMKISIFAGVLLLSAAVLSVDGQSWVQFQNKHINDGMTAGQCTAEIAARRIVTPPTLNNPRNSCKVFNTFINTRNVNAVLDVCVGGGTPHRNGFRISTATFSLIDCNLVNQVPPAVPYNCRYNGVARNNRRIIVRCENGQPVHFHGSQ